MSVRMYRDTEFGNNKGQGYQDYANFANTKGVFLTSPGHFVPNDNPAPEYLKYKQAEIEKQKTAELRKAAEEWANEQLAPPGGIAEGQRKLMEEFDGLKTELIGGTAQVNWPGGNVFENPAEDYKTDTKKVSMWWKGFNTGIIIGGFIVFLLMFFL